MNNTKRKPPAVSTRLDPDVDEQLRWLAHDLRTSVSGLLRWGAMLVLLECGEELPESIASLRRRQFGGEVPKFAGEINPETISVWFDDPIYNAIKRRAEGRGVTVERWVADLVRADLGRRFPEGPALN